MKKPREPWRESRYREENSESGGWLISFKKVENLKPFFLSVPRTQIRRKMRRGRKRRERREQRRGGRGKSGKT